MIFHATGVLYEVQISVSTKKVLLTRSYTHSFMCCLGGFCIMSCCDRVPMGHKAYTPCLEQSTFLYSAERHGLQVEYVISKAV